MQVIVGLGNPGTSYQNTRHNVGWQVLDQLARDFKADDFRLQKKLKSELAKTGNIIFIKPQTFMNESGVAVRETLKFYADFEDIKNQALPNLFVIHDDLDLELGRFKLQLGTGPKIHNGLLSLYQHLGTNEFWHVRIGVDSRQGNRTLSGREYVLQKFSPEEKKILESLQPKIMAEVTARLDTIQ